MEIIVIGIALIYCIAVLVRAVKNWRAKWTDYEIEKKRMQGQYLKDNEKERAKQSTKSTGAKMSRADRRDFEAHYEGPRDWYE